MCSVSISCGQHIVDKGVQPSLCEPAAALCGTTAWWPSQPAEQTALQSLDASYGSPLLVSQLRQL